MAEILKGKPVADAINEKTIEMVAACRKSGVQPTLAILRVGEREDDAAYERSAMKRCEQVGITVKNVILPSDVSEAHLLETLTDLNMDPQVHGILMLRPLPRHIDGERARKMLLPEKDVDGCTDGSLAGVFTDTEIGFAPCTAEAAMEILKFYRIPVSGKRAAVIGRSLVVGRPVAMMLMHENATVTICHTRTKDVAAIVRSAEIVIAATGQMESINASYFREGQVVVDVGIGWNEEKQKLCGDVRFEDAEPVVAALTPVPGGVGSVTTSLLTYHVAQAAQKKAVNI